MTSRAAQVLERVRQAVLINEGVYDPSIFKAVFMAGGGGSGKGFVGKHTTGGHGFRAVNSDDLVELFLTRAGLSLDFTKLSKEEFEKSQEIRKKAKTLTGSKLKQYLNGRLGLLIDGTAKDYNKIKGQKLNFEELGYDAFMIFVNTSLDVAIERNKQRGERGGRTVRVEAITKAWNDVQNNIGKFQNLFGKNFIVVDNSDPKTSDDKVLAMVWKEVAKFARKSTTNPIAKKWIKSELEKRKRT